jgi:hypothetical protein
VVTGDDDAKLGGRGAEEVFDVDNVVSSLPLTSGEDECGSRLSDDEEEELESGVGEDVEKLPEDEEYITTERNEAPTCARRILCGFFFF